MTPLLIVKYKQKHLQFQEVDGVTTHSLKPGSDHAQLSEELWRFFTGIYGGGPEIKLHQPYQQAPYTNDARAQEQKEQPLARRFSRKFSESDREEYCTKSTSEMNLRDTVQGELQKNQSLQNISRRRYRARSSSRVESDEEVSYRALAYRSHEPNGNYHDSDDEMAPRGHANTVRMENGVDSSDHDANEDPSQRKKQPEDLPNMDRITLKGKPKQGKVRKIRRRTAK